MTRGEKDLHSFQLYTRIYNCLSSDRKGNQVARALDACSRYEPLSLHLFSPSLSVFRYKTTANKKKREAKEENERER